MTIARISVDRRTIPQELLSLAKDHMRVTEPDDDRIIVHKLAASIDIIERLTGFGIFRAEWEWTPGTLGAADTALGLPSGSVAEAFPVLRVGEWSAKDDADVDISDDYTVIGDGDPEAITPQYLSAAASSDVEPIVGAVTGFATASDVPPMILDTILRLTAYLFEFREIQNVPGVDNVAYANSLITHWWVPRC